MKKIHHIGIVVTNLDEALAGLGMDRSSISESVYDEVQMNELHFVFLEENQLWIEFVEPKAPGSTVTAFASRFGIGLHHLGFSSDDLDESEASHSAQPGVFRLGRYNIDIQSFGGRVHTSFVALKGLILEYVKGEKR